VRGTGNAQDHESANGTGPALMYVNGCSGTQRGDGGLGVVGFCAKSKLHCE
jgi:hypothetical protein